MLLLNFVFKVCTWVLFCNRFIYEDATKGRQGDLRRFVAAIRGKKTFIFKVPVYSPPFPGILLPIKLMALSRVKKQEQDEK